MFRVLREDEARQEAPDDPTDVRLPRDVGPGQEPDHQVQPDDHEELHGVAPQAALQHEERGEETEDRAGSSDDRGARSEEASRAIDPKIPVRKYSARNRHGTEHVLEHPTEDPQRPHVEQDVEDARVHEQDRHHAPGLGRETAASCRRTGCVKNPPLTWSSSQIATVTATMTTVAFWSSMAKRRRATVNPLGAPDARRFAANCARCSRTHSGQCTPTAAGVWHSGQIVRPQRWQRTKLCRSGCR